MISSVELVNFISHFDTKLEFDNDTTVFVGKNGAGKSTIIDAITFALFGEHTRGSNRDLLKRGTNQGYVKAEFSANGKNYQALRKINSKGELVLAQLSENIDGNIRTIAEGERKQFGDHMSKQVEKILGVDYKKLKIASVVQQNELRTIINSTGKDFKEILNTIIGIDGLDIASKSMGKLQSEFRSHVQGKFGYDDTHIHLIEDKITEYENESKNAKPRLEQLVIEKKKTEELISNLEKEIQTNASKESQLKELDLRKNELISYARDVIKSIQREVSEKEQTVNECKPCFEISRNKEELEFGINKIQKNLVSIESELSELEKKQARYEEKEELAAQLELKDGKCPVCKSNVDHLDPDFQKEHIENEIEEIKEKIEELENERGILLEKSENLSDDLEESKEAATILKTHKITEKSQLEEMITEIKIKTKQIQKIPITVSSGQLVDAGTLDDHAKSLYENITILEKSTEDFNHGEFLEMQESLSGYKSKQSQIDQEYGEISGNIKKMNSELENLHTVLVELKQVHGYMIELEEISNNVYKRDGPVGQGLRSWSLDVISQKASSYLEQLSAKILRISLSEINTKIKISCHSRNETREISTLSGGERVSVALALRLGMSELLGASNLNFMIFDEPTDSLDSERKILLGDILSKLTNIQNENSRIQFLIITHEPQIFNNTTVENIYKCEESEKGTVVTRL
jgi:exonuclease SbcC